MTEQEFKAWYEETLALSLSLSAEQMKMVLELVEALLQDQPPPSEPTMH